MMFQDEVTTWDEAVSAIPSPTWSSDSSNPVEDLMAIVKIIVADAEAPYRPRSLNDYWHRQEKRLYLAWLERQGRKRRLSRHERRVVWQIRHDLGRFYKKRPHPERRLRELRADVRRTVIETMGGRLGQQ